MKIQPQSQVFNEISGGELIGMNMQKVREGLRKQCYSFFSIRLSPAFAFWFMLFLYSLFSIDWASS